MNVKTAKELQEIFKKKTGKAIGFECYLEDEITTENIIQHLYYEDYVHWLEKMVLESIEFLKPLLVEEEECTTK